DVYKRQVSNMIKSVVGWDIALTMTEIQPEIIKISMRTRDSQKYDLAKIAVATKAGGGHKAAAGATLNMTLPQAKETILAIIKKLYPKINQ
ncbi:MAG: DHHA1 domain-containing protein, partial [Candidatus Shapirobacteria bacterium]|nr:DHHA1 domain-containing protein [Candidatus Shapirobacteria bacterium]